MRVLYTFILLASIALAQTNLTTPAVIKPNAAHTVGGELRIVAPNNVDFASIQTTGNAVVFKGRAAGNGNIVLQPGNVAALSSVVINSQRLDTPGLVIQDASGTTSAQGLQLKTFGGLEYFSVRGGTDASVPGQVHGKSFYSDGDIAVNGYLRFDQAGGAQWYMDGLSTNTLSFRDSSANLQAYLDASTSFINFTMPSIRAGSTAPGNIAAQIYGFGTPSVDILQVRSNFASGTSYLKIDSTGGATLSSLAGSGAGPVCRDNAGLLKLTGCGAGSSPFIDSTAILYNAADNTKLLKLALGGLTTGTTRTLTPQNADYILAGTNLVNKFTSTQQFDQYLQMTTGGTVSYQIDGLTNNQLTFRDSSANTVMYLDSSTSNVNLTTPSIRAGATANANVAMQIYGFTAPSVDILEVRPTFSSGTTYLKIDSTGGATFSSLAGGGTIAVCADNSGKLANSGCGTSTPAAWTSYTPSTTNLSSTSTDAAYSTFGKDTFVRVHVNGVSNGSVPTFSLPVTAKSSGQNFPGYVALGGAVVTFNAYMNSTTSVTMNAYNNTAVLSNGTTYDFVFTGVYEAN